MLFQGPKLKPIFSNSGGKPPQPERPAGLMDVFKAKAVEVFGPAVCENLSATLKTMQDKHTTHGVAHDVTTHFALQTMTTRINTLRDKIQQGGAEGFRKMNEARQYVSRIQQYGLEA